MRAGLPIRFINRRIKRNKYIYTSVENKHEKSSFSTYIVSNRMPFRTPERYIRERFWYLKNTTVVLGYNLDFNIDEFRAINPNKKIVIYQMEQLYGKRWWNRKAEYILRNADEVWDYSTENIAFLKQQGIYAKYVPLMYCEGIDYGVEKKEYEYDIIFYGSRCDRRLKIIDKLNTKYKINFIYGDKSIVGKELIEEAKKAKIALNIHYFDKDQIQEQARIFELLNNNIFVVSEKSGINYYEGIVPEFDDENDMFEVIDRVLENKEYEKVNVKEKLKELTEKDRTDILAICFTYNELDFLKHTVKYYKEQGCRVYVIDNMSTDGTWEWLQENNIESHRFDTNNTFFLTKLMDELIAVTHRIRPRWVIRFDSDSFIVFNRKTMKKAIEDADKKGYNIINNVLFQPSITGEEDESIPEYWNRVQHGHLIAEKKLCFIAKYEKDILWFGDVWKYSNTEMNIVDAGVFVNYGNAKKKEDMEEKKERRERAYEEGENRGYGGHYFRNAKNNWVHKNQKHYSEFEEVKSEMAKLIKWLNKNGKDI